MSSHPPRHVDERHWRRCFGLGYIIGLRYAAVIAAGSVFAYLVLVPLVLPLRLARFPSSSTPERPTSSRRWTPTQSSAPSSNRSASAPSPSRASSASSAWARSCSAPSRWASRDSRAARVEAAPRTQTDMSPRNVVLIQIGSTLLMALLFFVVGMTSLGRRGGGLLGGPERSGTPWSARWWASPCRSSSLPWPPRPSPSSASIRSPA